MKEISNVFAATYGLPNPPKKQHLDDLSMFIEEYRRQKIQEDSPLGDISIPLAAYAGSLITGQIDGEWVFHPDSESMDIVHLRAGKNRRFGLNLVSKLEKNLRHGKEDSVTELMQSLFTMNERA